MIATWLPLVLPALVALAWFFLPGLPITLVMRLRPVMAVALSPLVSVFLITVTAVVASSVGIPWGPLPVLVVTVVTAVIALGVHVALLRHAGRRLPSARSDKNSAPASSRLSEGTQEEETEQAAAPTPQHRHPRWRVRNLLLGVDGITAAAIAIGAVLMTRHVRNALDAPDALSQTYDNIFHQNAVRRILETGDASTFTLGLLTSAPGSEHKFYPAGWHDMVSLVLLTLGSENIPLATNAVTAAVCIGVWVCGSVALTREVLPASLRRLGLLPAGVLTASIPAFPWPMLGFGVLYPNLIGYALIPALLVPALHAVGAVSIARMPQASAIILGLIGTVGITICHPNAAMLALALAAALCVAALLMALGRLSRGRNHKKMVSLGWVLGASAVVAALIVVLWPRVRPSEASASWLPSTTEMGAVGQALLFAPHVGAPAWILTFLLAAGLYAAVRRRLFIGPLLWLAVMVLWVTVAGTRPSATRMLLTGIWYNDSFRLAAALGLVVVPILTLGVTHVLDTVRRLLLRHLKSPRALRRLLTTPLVLGTISALALVGLTQRSTWMNVIIDWTSHVYEQDEEAPLLTPEELALIEKIPSIVPPDAVIITDAWNGSSLVYAYTGIETTTKHTSEHTSDEDLLLREHLNDATFFPGVCQAIRTMKAQYVLDFGPNQINKQEIPRDGFEDLDTAPGFEKIAGDGDVALYRITACR